MVKLKNIKKNNNTIGCDIYPEDSDRSGHVLVDIDAGDIKEYTLPNGYEWCINHVYHAASTLIDISHQSEVPNEKIVMWY